MTEMISILATSLFAAVFASSAHGQNSDAIPAGIEEFHRTTSPPRLPATSTPSPRFGTTTLSSLQPGTPPIVGKAAFLDFMKQAFAKLPSVKKTPPFIPTDIQ